MSQSTIEKQKASRDATRARRKTQTLKVHELKISRLSKTQTDRITRMFLEAKWLRNTIVATGILEYTPSNTVQVKLPDGTVEDRTLNVLPAHVKQTVLQTLKSNVQTLATLKRKGKRVGAIKYSSRVNSLEFKTGDIRIEGCKAHIPKLGWVRVRGAKQLGDEIANVRLVRKASGYYLLVASATKKKEPMIGPKREPIGLDFGIKTHVTTSDGRGWSLVVKEPESLKRLQRKLSRQTKHSNNYYKTLDRLNRSYERLSNKKSEAANKFVAQLKKHETIVFQDENLSGWQQTKGFGRTIQHSALGRVKAKLKLLDNAVMLDRFLPTTQYCSECGSLNKLSLSTRVYSCGCGYHAPRDVHAARNMLFFHDKLNNSPVERGGALVEDLTSGIDLFDTKSGLLKQETRRSLVV